MRPRKPYRCRVAEESPLVVEIDSSSADAAYRAFLSWAEPRGSVKVLFGPDVNMAIDSGTRRGYLLDEVYWVTLYAERGVSRLSECLGDQAYRVPDRKPNPGDILTMILERGQPLDEVKHLI